VSFAAVPQWFGFAAPLLLKGALLVLCVGSVVWLNRQSVAPANAVGVGSMNPDALSDLVLLLVCAAILWFHLRQRPAVAVAAGLIGLAGLPGCAAVFGLGRDAGATPFHQPAGRLCCVSVACIRPALGRMRRWPHVARRSGVLCWSWGGVGIVLTLAGLVLWSQVVPGVCALVIAWTAVQQRNTWGMRGHAGFVGQLCGGGYWQGRQQLPGTL
jgi:hypothetical protein